MLTISRQTDNRAVGIAQRRNTKGKSGILLSQVIGSRGIHEKKSHRNVCGSILFIAILLWAVQGVKVATAVEGFRGAGAERTVLVWGSHEDASGNLERRFIGRARPTDLLNCQLRQNVKKEGERKIGFKQHTSIEKGLFVESTQ